VPGPFDVATALTVPTNVTEAVCDGAVPLPFVKVTVGVILVTVIESVVDPAL
jgi:hypothetical protein